MRYGAIPSSASKNASFALIVNTCIYSSLKVLWTPKGRINDACTLIRKLFDDILLEIYMDVILKDKFSMDNCIVEEVNEWIHGKHRIPKTGKTLKYLETLEKTKDLYPLFG